MATKPTAKRDRKRIQWLRAHISGFAELHDASQQAEAEKEASRRRLARTAGTAKLRQVGGRAA